MNAILAFFGAIGPTELVIILLFGIIPIAGIYVVLKILKNTSEIARNTRKRNEWCVLMPCRHQTLLYHSPATYNCTVH